MIKIVKDTVASLRAKSKPVDMPLSPKDKATLDEMLEYLHLSQDEEYRKKHPSCREGVGLAAPQIGVNKRMLVISYDVYDENGPIEKIEYQLVNPKIIVSSIRKCYLASGEGCLSVDEEHAGRVYRNFKIVVDAYDALDGKQKKITARGFDAIVIQHEIDHLDGVLFYDHIDAKDPNKEIPGAVAI